MMSVDKPVDKMSVDKMFVDKISEDNEFSLDNRSLEMMSVRK